MFVGEIRMFAGNYAPTGWVLCNGALLPIAENETLFTLIGTTYGGDGETTFAVPDMRGRVPIHRAADHPMGELGGVEQVTLIAAQLPPHTHLMSASSAAPAPATTAIDITGLVPYVPASPAAKPRLYAPAGATLAMAATALQPAGGSQPHNNMAPYLGMSFIISLSGIFPSQN